jgi:uncharacterized membrane protein
MTKHTPSITISLSSPNPKISSFFYRYCKFSGQKQKKLKRAFLDSRLVNSTSLYLFSLFLLPLFLLLEFSETETNSKKETIFRQKKRNLVMG